MKLLLVLQAGKPGLEELVAEGALEGPVLAVEDHVFLQVGPAGEGLQADLVQGLDVCLVVSWPLRNV